MDQKKETLKKLEKLIKQEKEIGDFYEEGSKEKNNTAAKNRCYFSRINQYKLLVEKTRMELDNLLSKFDINSGSILGFSLARFGYYKKELNKLNKEFKQYSDKLKEYTGKCDELFLTSESLKNH